MKNLVVMTAISLALSCFCSTAHALIALDPDKDIEVVKREVVNEDGTISVIEEPVIKKTITMPEVETPERKEKKATHARGWDARMGKYKPKPAMFSVSRREPENWPLARLTEMARRGKPVPAEKPKDRGKGLHWLISVICLAVISFAAFQIYMYQRRNKDPRKVW